MVSELIPKPRPLDAKSSFSSSPEQLLPPPPPQLSQLVRGEERGKNKVPQDRERASK